jgi:hypothetical protein
MWTMEQQQQFLQDDPHIFILQQQQWMMYNHIPYTYFYPPPIQVQDISRKRKDCYIEEFILIPLGTVSAICVR